MAFNMMDLLNNNSRATQDKVESISKFKTIQINIDDLVPSRNNFYSIEEGGIKELKDSIELLGLQQNLVVNKLENGKYQIIAGHRRYMAMKILYEEGNENFKSIPCKVEEDDNIKNELRLIITNSTTRELSDWEKIHQASKLKELLIEYKKREKIPGRVRDIIANILNVSATQIARMESISKNLIEEFKEELKEDKVKFSSAYELSKLDEEKQKEIYEDHKDNNSNITIKDIKKKAEAKDEKEEIEVLEGQVTVEETLDISKEDLKVNNEDEIMIQDDKGNVVTTIKVNKETGEIVKEKTVSKFRNRIFIELEDANLSDRVRYETLDLVQEYDELTTQYKNNDVYIDFISNSVNEGDIQIILNSEGIEIKAVDHFDLIEIYNKVILIAH